MQYHSKHSRSTELDLTSQGSIKEPRNREAANTKRTTKLYPFFNLTLNTLTLGTE